MTASNSCARPTRDTSWKDVAWLMVSDVVGTSVLTFAGVAHQLGYFLTITFICGLFPVSLYVSVLMARTRTLLLASARMHGEPEPKVGTMGEITRLVFGTQSASVATYASVYGYTLLGQASYLLAMGQTAQGFWTRSNLCIAPAIVVSCLCLLPLVVGVRRLNDAVTLCRANSLLALAVVVVSIWAIVMSGERCVSARPYAVAPDLTLMHIMGPATNVLYAYAGQWMYFELMDTMTDAEEFPKAFLVTGPFMVGLYLAVAMAGTFFGVVEGDIVMGMPRGAAFQVTCTMLFVHVIVVYLIKSIVLARYFHSLHSPEDLELKTAGSFAKHAFWGILMLVLCFLVANAIPFFSELMGLIGGLLAGPINFIAPVYLFLVAHDKHLESTRRLDHLSDYGSTDGAGRSPQQWLPQQGLAEEDASEAALRTSTSEDSSSVDETPTLRRACRALCHIPPQEAAFIVGIVTFVLLTMVLGVSDVVRQIIAKTNSYGAPFSCHLLEGPQVNASECPRAP